MSAKYRQQLAESLNIHSIDKEAPFGASACGSIDGYPVAVSWIKANNQSQVAFLICFKVDSMKLPADVLKEKIANDPEILTAMDKKKLSKAEINSIVVDKGAITFSWHYSLRDPKPESVRNVLLFLMKIVKDEGTEPVGTKCEECGSSSGELYSSDGIPIVICAGCREKAGEQDRVAIEEYQAKSSNIVAGVIAGIIVTVITAILWALIAYFLNRVFLIGAVLIGVAVAWAVNKGMGKVHLFGQILTAVLTLLAVVLGNFLHIMLVASKELKIPLSMDLAQRVYEHFIDIQFADSSGYISILFGLIGAGYILYVNRAPVAKRNFVRISS